MSALLLCALLLMQQVAVGIAVGIAFKARAQADELQLRLDQAERQRATLEYWQ